MNKLSVLFTIYLAIFIAIILKLFFIQIIASERYSSTNYLKTQQIVPHRGVLLDRNGEPFALNQTLYRLYVEKKFVTDKEELINSLDEVLAIGTATLSAKLDSTRDWIAITNGVDKEKKEKLEKKHKETLRFEAYESRYYPEASLSAHMTGFVGGDDAGGITGYFGLEGYYQKDLAGLPGIIRTERDLFGNPILIGVQNKLDGEDGRNLTTTIDKTVQYMAKNKLKAGIERYRAKEGCIVVANPNTMEILAMTCLPDFDPNTYGDFDASTYKNPVVSTLYEPGSIFKPLIVAAGLNEGAIQSTDTYNETGPIEISGSEIETWDKKYEGEISMTRILEKSSNVGMVYIGERLGHENLLKYIDLYGFGEKTGIDVQGEVARSIKKEQNWYEIDYAAATFGQGIVVTPIQMVRAFSAIINGGWLMQPYVVGKVTSADGSVKETKPKKIRQVISGRTSYQIRAMLQRTVENAEVKFDKITGFAIGGKTGTAQVAIRGTYDPSKTIASFIGFAPVDDPKFVALVMYREPQSSIWGSETAAPTFFDLARELLVYYNIAPK